MHYFAVILCTVFASCAYGQQPKNLLLPAIFPVDSITTITIDNVSGIHTLSTVELANLKALMKKATFAGGLLVKPTHIILKITLKQRSLAKPGFTYCNTGAVHFDNGRDRRGNPFFGTFTLPEKLNFDNYR